jgi:hypothetical protein
MFQTKEELDAYIGEPRIRCLECGRRFKILGTHLRRAHQMEPDAYREKYGIPYKVGLACPEQREIARQNKLALPDLTARMNEMRARSLELQKVKPHREMSGAPIIRSARTAGSLPGRRKILDNDKKFGRSERFRAAARMNAAKLAGRQQGENSPSAKLTAADVKEIRALPRGYGKTKQAAERFGVCAETIRSIWRGGHWKTLQDDYAVATAARMARR